VRESLRHAMGKVIAYTQRRVILKESTTKKDGFLLLWEREAVVVLIGTADLSLKRKGKGTAAYFGKESKAETDFSHEHSGITTFSKQGGEEKIVQMERKGSVVAAAEEVRKRLTEGGLSLHLPGRE